MNSNNIKPTADGSFTLHSTRFDETYHSTFGAVQESKHIFIEAGLDIYKDCLKPVKILEIGFGTGLNALLSQQWSELNSVEVDYFGIEAYPIDENLINEMNYPEILSLDPKIFRQLHQNGSQQLSGYFQSEVLYSSFETYSPHKETFDLIYFDAFSPETQPEMWTMAGFQKLFDGLKPGGILVTYSCKGVVKRALKGVGFKIEKLPGPPGKREFVRAIK